MQKLNLHSLLVVLCFSIGSVNAQCDFIDDITGLALATPPAGNAANPALFTTTYVLVDAQGNIVATNSTPDFLGLTPAIYDIYAINYDNTEAAAVAVLLAPGSPWSAVQAYGDNGANCLDYTGNYGGCSQSVCDVLTIDENATLVNPAFGFNGTASYTQEYCLVCGGVVQGVNATGTFDLSLYPAAVAGADCEVVAMNYLTANGAPVGMGDTWSINQAANCATCWDYVGRDLDITSMLPVEMIYFTGQPENDWNRLDWATATEINCDYFIVERSHDGVTFEEIGMVDGAGNTQVQQDYHFYDRYPENNVEYYRLRQVDFNGNFSFTNIVVIQRSDIIEFTLFPNPAGNFVNVQLSSEEYTEGHLSVLDAQGKLVYEVEYNCAQNGTCVTVIPMASKASGIYCLLVRDRITGRVLKERFSKR